MPDIETLRNHSVRTLFERHRISLPGILMMTAALLFAYRDADWHQLEIWTLCVCFASLMQWWCIRAYFRKADCFQPLVWARMLMASSGLLGLILGFSAYFFMDVSNHVSVVLVTLLLVSPIYGSTVIAASYFPIHAFWCIVTTVPLALQLVFSGTPELSVLGFAILVSGTPIGLVLGRVLSKEFTRSLCTRFENVQLIGKLRQEKERVETFSKDKSRFLASISHDLRQPLHALDLFHASLNLRLIDQDQQRLLCLARHSSHVLGEMLGELMDIARLDAGNITSNACFVPLAPLLRECAEEMHPMAEEKGLDFRIRLPGKSCINTDPVLFKRILRNLLSNAIRYTQQGGVLLGTRMRGDFIHIEVHDTGSGIGKEQLPHIFNEFYQIDNPERDREKGLGLGLAIVRRVADMLGYVTQVRSSLGRGSCFSIAVPLCAVSPQYKPESVLERVDVAGLFVLVVDDDRAILQGMRELLLGWGCEVLLAESESKLITKLTAHKYPRPDVLMSDYRLRDGHTGLEVVAAVQDYFNADIPALIISGDVHPGVEDAVKKTGCRWLEKPVQDDVLRRMIAELTSAD